MDDRKVRVTELIEIYAGILLRYQVFDVDQGSTS